MKRRDVTPDALRQAAMRSTRASAALENRAVPAGTVRSDRVEQFLADRKKRSEQASSPETNAVTAAESGDQIGDQKPS
jgi:hypothetical protein